MMTKNKSNQIRKAKYLLLLPLLASMLMYTSCETNKIEEVLTNEVDNSKIVPASSVDELPYFVMDEVAVGGKKENLKGGDFHSRVRKLVVDNFNADISKELNLSSDKFKIYCVFTVNTKGEIENVRIRAPHPKLKAESERVLALIPKLEPAMKDGKPVAMNYTLPITVKSSSTKKEKLEIENDVPFAIIEEVPVYPGCTGTKKEKTDCLNSGIKKFVITNFNGDLAGNLGLPKGRKKIWVVFRIDEKGNVTEIKAKAPHPKLQEEAIRVANLLPRMEPGKQRGKTVGMKYVLPISFNIE